MWSQAETHDGASWYVATATVEQGGVVSWWYSGTQSVEHMHAYTDTPWQLKVTDNLALKFD